MFRSLLFIPANNPSMLQNADIFVSDGVIFDLEDAIAMDEKDNARSLLETYLNTQSSLPKTICVRVNDVFTDFIDDDLTLLKTKKIDYLVLPKANIKSLNILKVKLMLIEKIEQLPQTKIICLLEDTSGILESDQIAADERVEGLLLGAEDLTKELETTRTTKGDEILFARSQVIYGATHHKIISIDTPYTDINDLEDLKIDCETAKHLGMKAKTAIHPSQLEIINQTFSPNKDQIAWAKGVVEIYETKHQSLFSYQGKMIDKPVIERALKVIEQAKLYHLM